MRRFLAAALPILALLVVLYVIGSAGSARDTKSTALQLLPPAQRATTTPIQTAASGESTKAQTITSAQTSSIVTASRTDCRWRRYRDGAIGPDPDCDPGELDVGVVGHTGQTVCSPAWVAAASELQPPPATLERLLIEYQLPGSPASYVVARVVPVEAGGSPISPRNLYPLPLDGYGGQHTRMMVADQLHDEICSHKITVAQAANTLEGDWLSKGLPDDD